jgi:hypothetical protein
MSVMLAKLIEKVVCWLYKVIKGYPLFFLTYLLDFTGK